MSYQFSPQELEEFEFAEALEAEQAQAPVAPTAQPEEKSYWDKTIDEVGAMDVIGAGIEPIMTLGSGGLAAIGGGLAGIGELVTGGSLEDAAKTVGDVSSGYTYQPRTEGGTATTEAALYPFEKLAEGAEAAGGKTLDVTGSPELAAAVDSAIKLAPVALGGMKAGKSVKPVAGLEGVEAALASPANLVGSASNAIGRTVRNVVDPLLPGGIERSAGRAAVDVAGTRAPEVIQALLNSKKTINEPTVAQASVPAGSAEFSALMKLAETKDPSLQLATKRAQEAGRTQALTKDIAKTPEVTEALVKARTAETTPIYEASRQGEVSGAGKVVSDINKLIKENPGNKTLIPALKKVKSGLVKRVTDENGVVRTVPRTNAQEVLSSMDGIKALIGEMKDPHIKGILSDIKKNIAELSPKRVEADAIFAERSKPINQQQIGQELVKSLEPKLGSAERATSFANAKANAPALIKRATGEPRYPTLEKALEKRQMDTVNKVGKELDVNAALSEQARMGKSAMGEKLNMALDPPIAPVPMLSTVVMATRAILGRLKGRVSEKTLDYFAKNQNNPKVIAELMKHALPKEKAILLEELRLKNAALVSSAIAGAEENK